MKTISQRIAEELLVQENQVQAAIILLENGATVPFIARYRKEVTHGLDDSQLRTIEERLYYLRELDERREVILNSIREQNKLTPELETAIKEAETKTRLEDLYLPYKPKRRTKAQLAKEAGLEPLALALLDNPSLSPEETASSYINAEKGVADVKAALEGARQILMEKFSEEAELLGKLRNYLWENVNLTTKVVEEKKAEGAKFSDYFAYREPLKSIPSHRALALFRARKEGVIQFSLPIGDSDQEPSTLPSTCESMIAQQFNILDRERAADKWLLETVHLAWKFKIHPHLDSELLTWVRESSETEAIKVFARNLQDLLLAAPAGQRATMGLDPGLRTGVKVAVVDSTGKLLNHCTIYPHAPKNEWEKSLHVLSELAKEYQVELISIGNGTASRETDKLVSELISKYPELKLNKVVVSEAGASVYSASEFASQEFPSLDVSFRGAVSIARRLQDPLAELVKIDPKSIGVGQYQHDVSQTQLARSLDAVVEDCVNAVGVDLNTASIPLLSRVSGLNGSLARNIVAFRNENGPFADREILKKVPRLGEKTFEQAAGFLRIVNGDNPLDASAVHPEAYPVVEHILARNNKTIKAVLGDSQFLRSLNPADYSNDTFGIPTVTDILSELEKPGRDPRPEFKTAVFKEGVHELTDLKKDMMLEGVITNVTNFGAFVDIGVHQDGLVHISALSATYVKDPRDVVKAGDVVKVKVLEVDLERKRIALTMRLQEPARSATSEAHKDMPKKDQPKKDRSRPNKPRRDKEKDKVEASANTKPEKPQSNPMPNTIMAQAFSNARKG